MKAIEIRAVSELEARKIGARRFGCPAEEVAASQVSTAPDGSMLWQVKHSVDEASRNLAIDRAEEEISRIEYEAAARGLEEESLRQKGYIGPSPIHIGHGQHAAQGSHALVFEEHIDVLITSEHADILHIPDKDLESRQIVAEGTEIAHRVMALNDTWPPADAPPDYSEKSNVRVRPDGTTLRLTAAKNGYAVLYHGYAYIIPSDRDGSCSIRIDDAQMKVWCTITPPRGCGQPATVDQVLRLLGENGVRHGILQSAINASVNDKNHKETIVALGESPINGSDATANFTFDSRSSEVEFTIMPDGRIDYHKHSNILLVKRGELLATLSPPLPGQDGMNIRGEVLHHEPGESKTIACGENVVADPQEQNFYATEDGQVQVNGCVLSVLKHFHVAGDVDFRTGNINFPGNVSIDGSVQSGFEVIATGDIIIQGDIDTARLVSAGRDLTVARGVIGIVGGSVTCGRNFYAGHLQNAVVEAEGDVKIKNSCMHSYVSCSGKFIMDEGRGTVIGGEVNARGGIIARTIGSVTGTKTHIIAGQDFLVHKKIRELDTARDFFIKNIEKIESFLKPINDMVRTNRSIDPAEKQRLQLILEKRRKLVKELGIMDMKRRSIMQLLISSEDVDIRIVNELYPDVKVVIKDQVFTSAQLFQHCRFYLDPENGIQKGTL